MSSNRSSIAGPTAANLAERGSGAVIALFAFAGTTWAKSSGKGRPDDFDHTSTPAPIATGNSLRRKDAQQLHGRAGRTKTVINIDYHDTWRAGRERAVQGRGATRRNAITDRGRHGDHQA